MAASENNLKAANTGSGEPRNGGRVASLSRAAYRASLWILFGGAVAEMIFHAGIRADWNGGCVARTTGASRG